MATKYRSVPLTQAQTYRAAQRKEAVVGRANRPLRPFLAYDGEAVDNKFVLLANSRKFVYNSDGLTTLQCLDFLYRYEDGNPIRIGFAFEYDITMILQDLSYEQLKELMDEGETIYMGYIIRHLPRRIFSINRVGSPKNFVKTYYDTWAYFQSSFIKTITEYRSAIELNEEQEKLIAWGKEKRDEFHKEDMQFIQKYNALECVLLEKVLEVLRGAAVKIGWNSRAWYGPGTFAELLLNEICANDYRPTYNAEEGVPYAVANAARYGGRIELLQRGITDQKLYDYDINSAYPWAISNAPDMTGEWEQVNDYKAGAFGIYHVSWNCDDCIVGPLPFRDKDGRVYFPPRGSGYYHAVEVDAAIENYGLAACFGESGIYVDRGYLLKNTEFKPFKRGIETRYEQRKELKAKGDFSQIAIRLGLNAAYGKFAQRIGAKKHVNLLLSGFITASTRAALLRAIKGNESHIISFATDGLVSTVPLPLPVSKALGEWEMNESNGGEFYLPGIYRLKHDEWLAKYRGFYKLDFDKIPYLVHGMPEGTPVTQRIFVPYRLAVFAKNAYWKYKGKFIDIVKNFNPNSGHKRWWNRDDFPVLCWTVDWQTSLAAPIGEWGQYPDHESYPAKDTDSQEEFREESDSLIEESLIVSGQFG